MVRLLKAGMENRRSSQRIDYKAIPCWLVGFSLLFFAPSCSLSRTNKIASESVEQFRAAWRSGNYQQIYLGSDQAFKERVSAEDFTMFAETMRDELGEFQSSTLVEDRVDYTMSGAVVVLIYRTEFAMGKASEQFAWRIKRNQSFLYNYTLNLQIQINRKQLSINPDGSSIR